MTLRRVVGGGIDSARPPRWLRPGARVVFDHAGSEAAIAAGPRLEVASRAWVFELEGVAGLWPPGALACGPCGGRGEVFSRLEGPPEDLEVLTGFCSQCMGVAPAPRRAGRRALR